MLLCTITAFPDGKKDEKERRSSYFIQPEFLIGKALPANSNFPETRLQTVYTISIGKYVFDDRKLWASFYNYPSVGISLSKSSFGHDGLLGNAYTILPYLDINLSKRLKNSFHLKLGLGSSYFTEHFDQEENPNNKAIGSSFTWTFQTSAHYSVFLTPFLSFNMGLAFIHHSNGHTQLPNLGLNSFLGNISTTFYLLPPDEKTVNDLDKSRIVKSRQYFVEFRGGLGMHEMGDQTTSLGRVKKSVYSFSVGGGIVFNRLIKLRTGFTYRYYSHYYNYIKSFHPEAYVDAPVLNASNLFIYIGAELLLGHFGIDTEIGLNIYKPFYKEHSEQFEEDSQTSYMLKRVFATRLGLKFYALNTSKNPRNNFFIGAHINANLGQADFSELSIGLVHRFKKISGNKYSKAY